MPKELSRLDYLKYINSVNKVVKETERRITTLKRDKLVAGLSYEDWCRWQNKEVNLSQLERNLKLEDLLDV
jgi:hypothetical protein